LLDLDRSTATLPVRIHQAVASVVHRGRNLKFLLRHLLRHLMKDKLPQNILAKRKQGLDIPVHGWLRGHLKPLLLDILNRKTVEQTGVVYWPHLESLIKLHVERKANYVITYGEC
jgi:asparagine synthase (glutamine-hydrolysing)